MGLLDRVFAARYDGVLAPTEQAGLAALRHRLLAPLDGVVVEVGAGTGLNIRHLPGAVDRFVACEPTPEMAVRLRLRAAEDDRVEVVEAPAHALPLDDAEADHAVVTLVLCTVDDLEASVRELARVVRPGGTVALVEHVASEHRAWHAVQRVVEPLWRIGARGCRLTRDPRDLLAAHGFDTTGLRPWQVPGAPPLVATAWAGHLVREG